jgi:hypothetical protein
MALIYNEKTLVRRKMYQSAVKEFCGTIIALANEEMQFNFLMPDELSSSSSSKSRYESVFID